MAYSRCRTCLSVAPVVIKKSTVDCIPLLSSSCGTDVTKHLAAGAQMEEKNGTSCFLTLQNSNLAWRRGCCVVHTAVLHNQGNLHAELWCSLVTEELFMWLSLIVYREIKIF